MSNTLKLVFIGDRFYQESKTMMSSLYTEDKKEVIGDF